MLIRYARVRTQDKDLEPLQDALVSLYLSRLTANGCSLPITTDCFWPISDDHEPLSRQSDNKL